MHNSWILQWSVSKWNNHDKMFDILFVLFFVSVNSVQPSLACNTKNNQVLDILAKRFLAFEKNHINDFVVVIVLTRLLVHCVYFYLGNRNKKLSVAVLVKPKQCNLYLKDKNRVFHPKQ